MNDNMQTNEAMKVQSPYYQAGTPNQMTSPYNASTGSGPSPHPIGTPGLNTSPCSAIDNCSVQRPMAAPTGHNPGFMQGPNVLPGPGQPTNIYSGPPGNHNIPSYGSSDDVNNAGQSVQSAMHSQYPMGATVVPPVSHAISSSIPHGRPSPSPCASLSGVKPGSYPNGPAHHHMANSATGDVYMNRPCSVGSADVPSPQTTSGVTQVDPTSCTAGGYPPGLPPGAPVEVGNNHMMARPTSRGQHTLYSSSVAPVPQSYCMSSTDGSQQLMNGLPHTVPSSHNGGVASTYAMQTQQNQQPPSGTIGPNTNIYGLPSHHPNGPTQGYYNHSSHMASATMGPGAVASAGGSTGPNSSAVVDGTHVGLPTPLPNGGGGPYSSVLPHQRLAHDGTHMAPASSLHHPHQPTTQQPMAQQYGAHHPGAPVPQPYGANNQGRFTIPPHPHSKPEMTTCSAPTTNLPPSPATPSVDGAKTSPAPSIGSHGHENSVIVNHTGGGNTTSGGSAVGKKGNNTSSHTPQDRFDGLTEEEVGKKSLPDFLRDGLDIIIIGFNPSLSAAHAGHYYAGPGNHFWSCVTESGLAKPGMTYLDDAKLPECGIGLTHMCQRPTKGAADLTREEIKEGIRSLTEKLKRFRPLIACFNGKGIYENFIDNKNFYMGKQPDSVAGTNIALFVMPSSSARCAQLPRPADKLPFYNALRHLRDYLKGRIPRLDEIRLIFKDYSEVKAFANAAENGGRTTMSESSKRKRKRGASNKTEAAANSVNTVSAVVPAGPAALGHPYHHHHPHARLPPTAGYGPPGVMPPTMHHPALPAPPPPPQYPGHMYAAAAVAAANPNPAAMMPRFHPGQQMGPGHPLPAISSLGQAPMHSAYYQNSMGAHAMPPTTSMPGFLPQSSPLMSMGYGHAHSTSSANHMAAQQSFYFPPYQLGPPPSAASHATLSGAGAGPGSDFGLAMASSSSVGGATNLDDLSLSEFLASSPSDSGGNNVISTASSVVDTMGGVAPNGAMVAGSQSYFGTGVEDNPTYTPL